MKDLPNEVPTYLLASRYCETDMLSSIALGAVRAHRPRLASRSGYRRLRAWSSDIWLSVCQGDPHHI